MTCKQIHMDEESEDEVLSFVVKEVEADPQPLQESFKVSQQEE